ncbi:glycosyltransferase [Nocardioides sp. GY 10127]|uniref:glycosyltransferase n=1 Tax=Nocardioides sp. GY 10127 TaxID=2569762 RepID=UPI0010A8B55D|nr:glycosyltransferase [Nocardioides sp. GY 10127]TIC81862.1 hypothetical protein E8D37_11865 [Nocardioides sp. GY 10127]
MSVQATASPVETQPVVLRRAVPAPRPVVPARRPLVLPDALPLVQDGRFGPVMLVSSGGGHFAELCAVADAWGVPHADRHWVVPRSQQTAGVVAQGGTVTFVPKVASRQLGRAASSLARAMVLHRRVRPSVVLSAGAAQAAPHLVAAAAMRTPIVYVESVARLDKPSLTGRLAAALPGTRLFRQATGAGSWDSRWVRTSDIYHGFAVESSPLAVAPTSVTVMLGTEKFGFRRLVDGVTGALPEGARVTWQVGNTDCEVDGEQPQRWLSSLDLQAAVATSDVVVTHGGAGSVLTALHEGRIPVVVPRDPEQHEHVDDHQVRMCRDLAARGLVVMVEPGEPLTGEHLAEAARRRAVPAPALVSRAG